jgi:predicted transcriptional regulator
MLPELLELNRIRLDDDLTYEELGERIGVSHTVIVRAMNNKTEPRDRTLHKMRRFLEAHKQQKAKGRRRAS